MLTHLAAKTLHANWIKPMTAAARRLRPPDLGPDGCHPAIAFRSV
jgi:hypothetical protein